LGVICEVFGQAQFIEGPMPERSNSSTLEPMLEWLIANLDRPVSGAVRRVGVHGPT
jgi:transcriptional regulator GlxA family with amidase domain